ncbi:MAG: hypothetical protein CM15mP126_7100 [Gammaproteobacteria bacterium]|nr:MAG: hypothetical protein CM15mP126_7100 [Gammaproteobacteria bacterium]
MIIISNNAKDVEAFERECDEVYWLLMVICFGVNWIKILAAVAPLLGLLEQLLV